MPIRLCVGQCGSGKTYHLQKMVANEVRRPRSWRFIVYDTNVEWPGKLIPATGQRSQPVSTVAGVKVALRTSKVVLLRPPRGTDSFAALDALATVAMDEHAILVVPEAYLHFPNNKPLPPNVKEIVHRFRHERTGLWLDSQHFADISAEIRKECRWLYVFALAHRLDLDRLSEMHRDLAAAALECAKRAAKNQPGWHVRVNQLAPLPPFTLRRE